ncbi:MAG: glutamate ligase domain-containing protein, partial [Verrucomicrobiales bacterium]
GGGGLEGGEIGALDVEISGSGSKFTLAAEGEGEIGVEIGVPGKHMVSNALLAAAVGLHFGLSLDQIARGLASAELTGGRLQARQIGGVNFVDDSYNANPDSMRAAVQTLIGMPCEGRRFAILGGMGELGEIAAEEHRKLGVETLAAGIDVLISVGELGAGITGELAADGVQHFEKPGECAAFLKAHAKPGDLVLVKGSRSAAMEQVLAEFEQL